MTTPDPNLCFAETNSKGQGMSIEEFIIAVYCWVDDTFNDLLKGQRLRERGAMPSLSDPEVIAMELIGEFFGLD
nr:hypothetical protein [Zooshikella ganghwensis]